MNLLDRLKEIAVEMKAEWSEEDLQLAATIGENLLSLTLRMAKGEDVGSMLEHAQTAAKNIAAGAAVNLAESLWEVIRELVGEAIDALLPG